MVEYLDSRIVSRTTSANWRQVCRGRRAMTTKKTAKANTRDVDVDVDADAFAAIVNRFTTDDGTAHARARTRLDVMRWVAFQRTPHPAPLWRGNHPSADRRPRRRRQSSDRSGSSCIAAPRDARRRFARRLPSRRASFAMWTAYARVASVVENALGINFHAFVACVTLVIALTYPKLAKSVSDRLDSRAMNDRERLERYQRNRQRALEKREEELRRAASETKGGKAELDRAAALEAKLAEIDAKAARLGLTANGKGRKLGDSGPSRPEWNPLMGGGASRGYRPTGRPRPGGGG